MTAFEALVVFGDSLSDIGNGGRFSNGPVWVEHMAERLGVTLRPSASGGTNYAVGGARAHDAASPHSLRRQADAFLQGRKPDRRTLHIVYGGSNDLLGALLAPDPFAVAPAAVAALGGIVEDLAAAGAADILVPNLPDIGRTPQVRSHGAVASQAARMLVDAFNKGLARTLDTVGRRHKVRLHRLDVFAMLERVAADPAKAGFSDIVNPAMAADPPDPSTHLFWDSLHPTTAAHARLGEAALATVLNGLRPR